MPFWTYRDVPVWKIYGPGICSDCNEQPALEEGMIIETSVNNGCGNLSRRA
jgi:hypothetical protein